jgi:uncharacterized protein (DUF433 family)
MTWRVAAVNTGNAGKTTKKIRKDGSAWVVQFPLAIRFGRCDPLAVNPRVQIDPTICHGKPVIRGTRVMVATILGVLGAGDTIETLLEDYPNLTKDDVSAALDFASRLSEYQVSAYESVA